MPRGKSRSSIKSERRAMLMNMLADVEAVAPDEMRSLVDMLRHDIQQESMQMAAARCNSMAGRLKAYPEMCSRLVKLFPDLAGYLKNKTK